MTSSHFQMQESEQPVCLSRAQYDAVSAHVANLLTALGIKDLDLSKADVPKQEKPHHGHPHPYITTHSPFTPPSHAAQNSPNSCVELETITPYQTLASSHSDIQPSPRTPTHQLHAPKPHNELWTPNERESQLTRAFAICIENTRELADNLDLIQQEFHFLQHGRAPKASGGNYSSKPTPSTQNPSNSNPKSDEKVHNTLNIPSFMTAWLPPPDPEPNPEDTPGLKRCTVGRPVGKVLRPGENFHGLGRCDKHHDKSVFETNMQVRRSAEGEYRLHEHAWKCSGQGTSGAPRELRHRL